MRQILMKTHQHNFGVIGPGYSATENDILNTLNDLRGTVTIIAISHQETFVNASDRKYLLENGKISGQEFD